MQTDPQLKVRIPRDLHSWIKQEAATNRSTISSEVVRAIRERHDRVTQMTKPKR